MAGDIAGARTWLPLIGLALICLGLGACSGRVPQATPGPGGAILADDFSDPNSGWDRHSGADVVTDYDDGRYLVAVNEAGVNVWARPGLELADAVIEADTQYTAGPDNNEYGLMCRYSRSGDRNSFYFFFVSSDGYYALGKVVRDARTILSPPEGSFQPTDAIDLELGAVNRLRAICQGDHLSLWAGETLVGEFTDSELTRGDVGVIVGSYDQGGVRIHFDNVIVRPAE